jgi:regulation of enolase protein 1 (concanavalin A-like superfamily)
MTLTRTPRARSALITTLVMALALPLSAGPVYAAPPDDLPTFGYQGEITSPTTTKYSPTDEWIFPSVFHAGAHLENPLGEWYLYTAPHDNPGGIIMFYADSLEGPWTEYGDGTAPLIANTWSPNYNVSHVSTPEPVWHEDTQTMVMYFHGENSTTRWATSTDGITFSYGGVALNAAQVGGTVNAVGYARVFPHPDPDSDYAWAMFFMSTEDGGAGLSGRRTIRLAESHDGFTWSVAPHYIVEPGEAEGANVSSANLWEWNGQLYVIYHATSGKIHARTIDDTLRHVGAESFVLHESSGLGEDIGRTAAPEIITHDGETYLFYEGGARLGAAIRWAKAGADVHIPLPFGGFIEDPDNPVYEECAAPGSDEFSGDTIDSDIWTRVVRPAQSAHQVVGGELRIPTYSGGVTAAPLLLQELPDDPWQVTTKVTINPQQTFQQAGLILYGSDSRYAKLDMARATPGRSIELVYHTGTSRTNQSLVAVFQNDIWLRLTSDGTSIRASVSYDGQVFERYGSEISVADAGFTHVGPFAFRGNGATQITAAFDWFRFSPSADDYTDCRGVDPGLDTTALEERLDEARAIDLDAYTAGTAQAVRIAIADAEAVLGDPADQQQIDEAFDALGAAIAALELVGDDLTVAASLTPGVPDGDDGWYRGPVSVTITAAGGDGTPEIDYRLDGDWISYVTPIVIDDDGEHELSYRARSGSETTDRTVDIAIDTTAPTVSATVSERSLSLVGSDVTSGIASLEYRIGSGNWSAYSAPIDVGDGAVTVTYRATDRAGNMSAVGSSAFAAIGGPSVQVTPSRLVAGETATVTGSGFLPATDLEVWLHSTPRLVGVVTTGGSGSFSLTFIVPADLSVGEHRIEVRDAATGTLLAARGGLMAAAPGGLAESGLEFPLIPNVLGLLLIMCGVTFSMTRRSRRSA